MNEYADMVFYVSALSGMIVVGGEEALDSHEDGLSICTRCLPAGRIKKLAACSIHSSHFNSFLNSRWPATGFDWLVLGSPPIMIEAQRKSPKQVLSFSRFFCEMRKERITILTVASRSAKSSRDPWAGTRVGKIPEGHCR